MSSDDGIWAGVDRLVTRAHRLAEVRSHGLEPFAARRWRLLGREIPAELIEEERLAAVASLTVVPLLERIRASTEGAIVLFKGPEVAARYPDRALRRFKDLDVLVADAPAVQEALLAAGFRPIGDPEQYRDLHHLRPLVFPGLPLAVEVHAAPKWLPGLSPPPTAELLAATRPAAVGVQGVDALLPAQHALVLAVHSWAHEPLRRLRDLVDVAAVADEVERGEIDALAARWGIERLWQATIRTADAMLLGRPVPGPPRAWAGNLGQVRERTVLETHLERLLSDFSALPANRAMRLLPDTLLAEIRPVEDETWSQKLTRIWLALRNAFVPRQEHDRELEVERRPPGP